MEPNFLSTDLTESACYLDLIEDGGLSPSLQKALLRVGSSLQVKGLGAVLEGLPVCARVERKNRFSQVYVHESQRMFSFDFWESGTMLGRGRTELLSDVARAISDWLEMPAFLTELEGKYSFINVEEKTRSFENGQEVDWTWDNYQTRLPKQFPTLSAFFDEAKQTPVLRRLFPFTSHNRFCFSRCTGYPYSADCPYIGPLDDGRYEVFDHTQRRIGVGIAKEAVTLVVENLPANCGPAIRGTRDDLKTNK